MTNLKKSGDQEFDKKMNDIIEKEDMTRANFESPDMKYTELRSKEEI